MKRSIQKILLAVIVLSALASCKKYTDRYSTMSLLTDRAWVVTRFEERDAYDPWTNTYLYWDECEKDDLWIFRSDYSLEMNESYLSCGYNPPHSVLDEISWYFADNETKIIIDGVSYRIERLDAGTLILSTTSPNLAYETRVTFKH